MRSGGTAVTRGLAAAAVLGAALLCARPVCAQSFGVAVGGSIVTDAGSIEDLRGFDFWGGYLAGELLLDANTYLQLRWTHIGLPGSQVDAPDKTMDSGNVIAGYQFQDAWFKAGLFLGAGYYHVSPDSPDEGEVAVDATEDVFGWTGGLMAGCDIGRRWDVRVEVSGHYVRTEPAHKPILFTVGVVYKF